MPIVSIIVPVYNVEKYINRCIDSILAQTFTDWECILVDDGSPDKSGEICDEYASRDSRIQVIHKQNGGVSSARNIGIKRATSEWITFVDSDDYLYEDSLFKMVELTKQYDADLYCFGICITTKDKQMQHKQHHETSYTIEGSYLIKKMLLYTTNCGPYSKLFRNKRLRNFCFDESVKIGEDLILNLQYLSQLNTPIVCSNLCAYNYYTNPSSAMHSKALFDEYNLLTQKVESFFSSDNQYRDEINIFKMINLFQPYVSILRCPSYSDVRTMMELNNGKLTKDVQPVLYRYMSDISVSYNYANLRLRCLYCRSIIKRYLKRVYYVIYFAFNNDIFRNTKH